MHGSEAERLSSLTAWIRRGLDRGDKVICAEGPRPAGGSVLDLVDGHGADLAAAAVASGQLAALPSDRFYPQGDQEAVVEQALAEGFPSVRLAADATAAFGTQPWPAHLDIERTIDRLCRTGPVSAVCQYAHPKIEPTMLRELIEVHRYRLCNAALSVAADPRGLTVSGEIDRRNAEVFATAVDSAVTGGERVLRLDLSGLEFMDVAACRQLLYATDDFRRLGGHVVLASPQWMVSWTLRLLGVDQFTGIELAGVSEP
nr:MEDS domain-containing protein [Planosporangium thailandense]